MGEGGSADPTPRTWLSPPTLPKSLRSKAPNDQKKPSLGRHTRSRFTRLAAQTRTRLEIRSDPVSTGPLPKTGLSWNPKPIPFQPARRPKQKLG